jgi:hypothetical protein
LLRYTDRTSASLKGAAYSFIPFDISSLARLDVGGRTLVMVGVVLLLLVVVVLDATTEMRIVEGTYCV